MRTGLILAAILSAACSSTDSGQQDAARDTLNDTASDTAVDTAVDTGSDTSDTISDSVRQDTQPSDLAAEAGDQGPDSNEDNCGGIGFIGACDGDNVLWCLSGEVFPYDCTDPALKFAGPDRTCGLQDCTAEEDGCKGYFCVVKEGKACDPLDPIEPALCDAGKHGCLGGVCAPSPACDEATYVAQCDGDLLTYCKHRVQNIDCTLGGTELYTCGQNSKGLQVCLGIEGGGCSIPKGYECAANLTCINNVCTKQ